MKLNGNKELELELYLLLGVVCSDCQEEWYAQDNGWYQPGASESDVEKMVEEYLPKIIELGWYVDIRDNILCPKCSESLKK
ncbi:hypothetical protein [Marinobacter salarius]|jgi:hypothetical protein|uniref:hypothetical protein n=1 Tax=Marinobacter salarius TaxID=1420917 RepID=UPI0018F1E4E4|nr:hypothetical protein [Marinobacter salarius]MBJ7301709.1 hypothetical protein [Marinobacter salarius]HIO29932.1 hypothetical protein [Marinobacter salarius]HIP00307.1 hypothetical protein [Marinobacter salarius]